MNIVCCFIAESFFLDHPHYVKMLDPGSSIKQSHRSYLCLKVNADGNDYYIPLRNNLGTDIRPYGRIGHSLPSESRANAGLDYRYALIINNPKYIDIPKTQRIPTAQMKRIVADYSVITSEFNHYLSGFKKALRKNRIHREALYRESSLINFIDEL